MREFIVMLVIVLTGCSAVPTSFTPANALQPSQFSDRLFADVLNSHVHEGLVDYPGVQADRRLPVYLAQLDRVDPNSFPTREGRMAFWINAYNAFAVQGILDQYSPMSVVGRYRYFIGKDYQVGGATINLYDLERQVLIKQFQEPRIHFAIVCASASCPKLQSWAYAPDQLERQLDRVARDFINDPTRNRFDRTKKVASLSMIFKWFHADFAKVGGSVLGYITNYLQDHELAKDLMQSRYQVEYLDYDWSLNGIPPKEMVHVGSP